MSLNQTNAQVNTMNSLMGLMSTAQEKWNSSGANDVVSRASASIPDSTKQAMASVFKREHIRSITVFFGVGEDRPFYVEKTPSLLLERLRHNLIFFYLNYFLMAGLLFCLTLITSPTALIGMGLLGLVWMWVIRSIVDGYLSVSGVRLPQSTVMTGMGIISAFLLFWLLKGVFWWALACSGFFIALHAFMRDASLHKDMEDAVAMEGDLHLGGEESTFLNPAQVQAV